MLSKIVILVFCLIFMQTFVCDGINLKGERTDGYNKCDLKLDQCEVKTGIPGKFGEKGVPGIPGAMGVRGDRGLTGPPGRDSEPNEIDCVERLKTEFLPQAGENRKTTGTRDRPSSLPCHALRNEEKGIIWVNPYNAFEVNCPKDSELTCLVNAAPKDKKYIEDNAFHLPPVQHKPFWLSNYYSETEMNQRFNLEELYKITTKQIDWLRQNTNKTFMKIRIHCKNFHVYSSKKTALHLLSWNDVIIRPYVTNTSPLSYTIDESAHECKEDAPEDEWRVTDITVEGDNKRLPVIDFHIRDTRIKDQSLYFELLELCFG